MERLKNIYTKLSYKQFFLLALIILILIYGILFFMSDILLDSKEKSIVLSYSGTYDYEYFTNEGVQQDDKFILFTSEDAIKMNRISSIKKYIFFLTPIFLSLCIFISLYSAYYFKIKRPINSLVLSANGILNGKYIEIESLQNDEIGHLSREFNKISKTLIEKERALEFALEEKNILNATFSHNIANPVTILKNKIELITETNSSHSKDFLSINNQIERLTFYIDRMRTIQSISNIKLNREYHEGKSLAQDIEETAKVLTSGKNLNLYIDINGIYKLDYDIFFQIFENLLKNAVEHSNEQILVKICCDKKYIYIEIENYGDRFPDKVLDGKFMPFQSIKSNRGGNNLGIGLYSSNLLAKAHHGGLEINNTKKGAKAKAYLLIV